MARDPKQDPYYNPDFSDEINEVTNDFVYKKTGKQTTGDAIIVRPKGDTFEVLLIERKRGPHQGGLALPGGFKEGADKVEDFVAREALEETGLKNSDIKQTIDLPEKTNRFDWDIRFSDGVDVSGKIFIVDDSFIPVAGDDAVSAKFVPVDDIVSGKVDVAFLHSEWIHDTSVKLNSKHSPGLQEIVDKNRTRNINLMEEINKKRKVDNQPLMNIEKANDNAEDFAKKFYNKSYNTDGFQDPNKNFDAYMLETTDDDIAEWYFEKTGKDWVSDTKTMSQSNLNKLKNDFKTDVAQDMVANFNDDLALSAREWLNENTSRGVDPTAQMDDTLAALEQSNADMFPDEVVDTIDNISDDIVIDTPNAPLKGNQLKQILKNRLKKVAIGGLNYLDMYELGLIGYAVAEPAAQKLLEPIMPYIIPGYKAPKNNESYKDQVIANLQETAKISPTAKVAEKFASMPRQEEYNSYSWVGKMLDR